MPRTHLSTHAAMNTSTPRTLPAGLVLAIPLLVTFVLANSLLFPSGLDAQSAAAAGPVEPFPPGSSVLEVDFDGTVLNLWAYRPENYVGDGFVLVLHGASRAAESYRDNARGFAREFGRLVVVPEFDSDRFPNRLYQMGGVLRADGAFADPAEHTYAFIPRIVSHIRQREAAPDLPWILLGYSAGAQFVARMAAFLDTDAERLVAMSPGSTLFPTRDLDFGLGFGGLPQHFSSDERIRRYLALPLTVAIGTADTEEGQLPRGQAFYQGVHRYARNLRWFVTAMELAHEHDWEFNWRLVLHHGAGHPHRQMFDHPSIGNALFGHRLER
jgi:poly(3-hydroxybutyrate) depolymerase